MAKSSITNISTTNTFQVWFDKTNELVNLVKSDILTATSATPSGDITVGNATLQGNFTANNVIASTLLRVDNISPKVGSTLITASAPINITTNQTVLNKLTSASGPRISFFNDGDTDWQVGFENNTTKSFSISNGAASLKLTSTGNLEITGILSGTAAVANAVTLVATDSTNSTHYPVFVDTATGIEQARTDSGFTYNPSTGTLTATKFVGAFTGTITGTAETATKVDVVPTNTEDAIYRPTFVAGANSQEIRTDSGFTYNPSSGTLTAINFVGNLTGNVTGTADLASEVTNGVYTIGAQDIAGLKSFTNAITFNNNIIANGISAGGLPGQDTSKAAIYGEVSQSGTTFAPIIKIRSTGSSNVTTSSFGISHTTGNTQDAAIHLIQAGNTNSRIWRFTPTGEFTSPGDVTAFSDERLKTNIKTIENPLDKVLSLRGVSFERDGKASIGVIAQEIEKIIPEVVHDGDYKSVAYGNLVGLLIEAIKELKSELDELKGK